MELLDVNVLIYAHRREMDQHAAIAAWITALATSARPFAIADEIGAAVVRIATNPRIWKPASTLDEALGFLDQLRQRPNHRAVQPSRRRWEIYADLLRASGATGTLSADAWHASLAIDQQAVFITCDGDFARFPGLKWRHPLAAGRRAGAADH